MLWPRRLWRNSAVGFLVGVGDEESGGSGSFEWGVESLTLRSVVWRRVEAGCEDGEVIRG